MKKSELEKQIKRLQHAFRLADLDIRLKISDLSQDSYAQLEDHLGDNLYFTITLNRLYYKKWSKKQTLEVLLHEFGHILCYQFCTFIPDSATRSFCSEGLAQRLEGFVKLMLMKGKRQ